MEDVLLIGLWGGEGAPVGGSKNSASFYLFCLIRFFLLFLLRAFTFQ